MLGHLSDIRVLMMTYNGGSYFESQLDSILCQKHLEGIRIYDDASTDDAFIAALKKCEATQQVNVHFHARNMGVVENVKYGILENLDANWLALSDQDDLWEPQKFQMLVEILDKLNKEVFTTPILVYHDMSLINEQDEKTADSFWGMCRHRHHAHNLSTLLFENFVTGCTTVFNPILGQYIATIPKHLDSYHDHWMALAAFSFGKVIKVDKCLNRYRKHAHNQAFGAIISQDWRYRRRKNLYYLLHPKTHLKREFDIASAFFDIYGAQMAPIKRQIFEAFLSVKKATYLQQVLFRRKVLATYSSGLVVGVINK